MVRGATVRGCDSGNAGTTPRRWRDRVSECVMALSHLRTLAPPHSQHRTVAPSYLRTAVTLLLVSLALFAGSSLVRGQTGQGPIKIGFIVPQSGPLAQNGRDILNGFVLF